MNFNKEFGLEIPGLAEAKGQDARQAILKKNDALIDKVEDLVVEVTGDTFNPVMTGPRGIFFRGPDGLAQDIADAFPAYKVIDVESGKTITPRQTSAPKATRQQSTHPRPKF